MNMQDLSGFRSGTRRHPIAVILTTVLLFTCFAVSCFAADALTPPAEEATTAPIEATTAPVEATTAPIEATTAPIEATTAPVEATTAPADAPTSPFSDPDLSAPLSLQKDGGGAVVVYPVEVAVDANADGKTNAADVRAVLRHTSKVQLMTIAESLADLTQDGRLNSTDARLLLRCCARLDKYYRTESGAVVSGLFRAADGRLFSLNEYGAADQGLKEIDGTLYCFNGGFAMTGPVSVGGEDLYFGTDGKPATGDVTVKGETVYCVDGRYFTGFREVDGKTICYQNGRLYSGFSDIDGTSYYFSNGSLFAGFLSIGGEEFCYYDGLPANGTYLINGVAICYENGKPFTGDMLIDGRPVHYVDGQVASGFTEQGGATYYIIDGEIQYSWCQVGDDYYYLDRETGKLATDTKVDGIPVGSNGAAVKTNYNVEKIKTFMKARKILLEITEPTDSVSEKKLKAFRWVMSFPYVLHRYVGETSRSVEGWEMLFANDIFETGSGCCASDSFAFAFLAVEAGCHEVYVCDDNDPQQGHAWTTMEGNNNVYDVVFAESKGFDSNYNAAVSDYRRNPPRKTYVGG